MPKRRRSPTPPPIGLKPDIKPTTREAKFYQTSDLVLNAIEQEQAEVRAKTARLRKERLKAERIKTEELTAQPQPTSDEIARVVSRMIANRKAQKK